MIIMKKIYILLGAMLVSGVGLAQSPWAVGSYDFAPNDKHAPGAITFIRKDIEVDQDRTTYYNENFESGFGAWTAAIQTGTAGFGLTSTGHQNTPSNTYQMPPLASSTPTQWVLLDSDADGTSYTNPEAATLTAGPLDLSAATGMTVAMEFEQFFAEWQPPTGETEDHLFLGISGDGSTWTEVEINEGAGRSARPNPEVVSWDITDEIVGIEGNVYLRFRWEGAWNYGWQIDNVCVTDIPDKDLTIIDTYRTYSSQSGIVYSQIPQAHTESLVIGAIIRNVGHEDLTGVAFDYEVFDPSMTSVAAGTASGTVSLSNMEQDTLLEDTGFTPSTLGNYTIVWSPVSVEGDDNSANDTVTDDHLMVTEYTYATDYDEGTPVGIIGYPLLTNEAFFGGIYDFQISDVLSGIDVKIANNSGNVGEVITYGIYQYNAGLGDWDEYDVNYNAYSLQAGDIGNWITISTSSILPVDNGELYMITVGQLAEPADPIFEQQGDIGFDYIQGRDEDGANRGFFNRLAPMVRPRIVDVTGVEEEVLSDEFYVFPNPAENHVNVFISLTDAENTTINVLDLSGKVINTLNLGVVEGDKTVSVGLDGLSSGVYFIEMINSNGRQVKKFAKK